MLKYCNSCGRNVLPSADDVCPACQGELGEGPAAADSTSEATSDASLSKGGFGRWLGRKSITLIIVGAALAAWGAFGGSYQRRGAGVEASGGGLVAGGLGLVAFGVVLLVVTKFARRS